MSNTEESLLKGLNEPQRQTVTTRDGPILVLAGAGSGKTKTLVHRLAYLISQEQIPPEQILAVTFTNQAAKEMRQRVQALIGRVAKSQPTVGTFHSVSARWLRHEAAAVGYPSHYSIYDEDDQLSLIKEALKAQGIG
ncbi:MAG TPA: DNA helicase II, partial [Candidatus Veblenbacteria bacterium]|nr:DNA helicase II [Candidatus Veblenbacteria bacterium]